MRRHGLGVPREPVGGLPPRGGGSAEAGLEGSDEAAGECGDRVRALPALCVLAGVTAVDAGRRLELLSIDLSVYSFAFAAPDQIRPAGSVLNLLPVTEQSVSHPTPGDR